MKAFKFRPFLKTVLWGGERIPEYRGIETEIEKIGESWEISSVPGHESVVAEGEDKGLTLSQLIVKYGAELVGNHVFKKYGTSFPLLVKIIDANDDLSVQVHPDDELAEKLHKSFGKTEMWYIIDSAPGAKIYAGLSRAITRDEYYRLIKENRIMDVVAKHDSYPGDVFFIPAGRIHSIGAGNLLLEVQETSDITYRVYDFDRRDKDGNTRELHTELAADAIDYKSYEEYKEAYDKSAVGITPLIDCRYFNVKRVVIEKSQPCDLPVAEDSFTIIFCVDGTVSVNDVEMKRGESLLVPAVEQSLQASGDAVILTITA